MPSEPDKASLQMAETELTKQWNADNERVAMRARAGRLSMALGLAAIAALLALFTFFGWAVITLCLAATAFVMYLDANGQVHEIRERSKTRLIPGVAAVLGRARQQGTDQPKHIPTAG